MPPTVSSGPSGIAVGLRLATLFREQTGQSVHSVVTQMRLHHAAALIRAGEKIEVVSLLVGYRSKKNFYRHFKEQYRVTPLGYRTAVLGLTPPLSLRTRYVQEA